MIQARCLRRSGIPLRHRHRAWIDTPLNRNLSSCSADTTPRLYVPKTQFLRSRTVSKIRQWPRIPYSGFTATRFASTTSRASPIADVQPEFVSPSTASDFAENEFTSTSLEDVISSAPSPVYEHVGFLKEMGLDYGWGTTAMMEWILEHVHIYAGTPWWASIGLSLIIVRAFLLKSYFDAADASARNQLIAHYNEPLMNNMKAAQARKDMAGVNKAMTEMKALRASAGVKYWKIFVPFIQVPIGFGTFRLMRGMAYLPVPGLDTGGVLWMQDLTLSDPYFILPVLTAASYYYSFKAGGEAGSTAVMNPAVKKIFLYVLPPFSGLIMCAWPGALQLTFFIQALISMIQSAALRNNWCRKIIGIQPVPEPSDTKPNAQVYSGTINRNINVKDPSTPKPKGILGGAAHDLRSAMSAARKQVTAWQQSGSGRGQTGRRTPGELKHAKAYEERRKRELAQEKFERQQEMQAKLVEKEERRRATGRKQKH